MRHQGISSSITTYIVSSPGHASSVLGPTSVVPIIFPVRPAPRWPRWAARTSLETKVESSNRAVEAAAPREEMRLRQAKAGTRCEVTGNSPFRLCQGIDGGLKADTLVARHVQYHEEFGNIAEAGGREYIHRELGTTITFPLTSTPSLMPTRRFSTITLYQPFSPSALVFFSR